MKTFSAFCFAAGLFAGVASSDLVAAAKGRGGLDVLIAADAIPSPEGFRPTPGHPIHYLLTQTRQTLGEAVAGVKMPDPATLESAVVRELEKQGFVKAAVGGPVPEIVIVATVGDSNFEPPPIPSFVDLLDEPDFAPFLRMVDIRRVLQPAGLMPGGIPPSLDRLFDQEARMRNDFDSSQARDLVLAEAIRIRERGSARTRDRGKIMSLVGAPKVDKALAEGAMSHTAAERIAWATREDRLYLTLNAFEAGPWKEKQRVLLWRTTMLIDWRKNLSESLTEMLVHAGPLFGTDVAVPGFVNAAKTQEGTVDIGDVKVVPEKSSTTTKDGKN